MTDEQQTCGDRQVYCGGIEAWCSRPWEMKADILMLPTEDREAALERVPEGCREWVRQRVTDA